MSEKRIEFLKELGNPYQREKEIENADRVFAFMQRSGATRAELAKAEENYHKAVAENEEDKRNAQEPIKEGLDSSQVLFARMESSARTRSNLATAEKQYKLAIEKNEEAKRDIP